MDKAQAAAVQLGGGLVILSKLHTCSTLPEARTYLDLESVDQDILDLERARKSMVLAAIFSKKCQRLQVALENVLVLIATAQSIETDKQYADYQKYLTPLLKHLADQPARAG